MHVGPVIPVGDLARARAFYEDTLGLEGEQTTGGWLVRGDGGSVAYLLPDDPGAGTASWPLASFRVERVHDVVQRLAGRGVEFLRDVPFALDGDGVSVDQPGLEVAWMRDPDGNVLTVFDRPGVAIAVVESLLEPLQRANEAVVAGDYEGFLDWCTDDTEWTFVGDRVLRGKDEVRRWMAESYREPPRLVVDTMVATEDTIVAMGDVTTTEDDGSEVTSWYCDVWQTRDAKLAKLRAFVIST